MRSMLTALLGGLFVVSIFIGTHSAALSQLS